MAPERRGQLDALLDVELLLPASGSEAVTHVEGQSAPVATQLAVPFAIGVELGKYRLERLLGAGGMGVVWAARDRDLDRVVALKVLSPTLGGDGVARARMVREARAMARLDHPNVIAVFDSETINGHDMIAMELIDGETMASWLGRGQPREAVIATLLAAGRGLSVAHAAGMVHRDFKPHNVLVDRGGRVVVTDFGLVRAIGEAAPDPDLPVHRVAGALDSALTATGTVMGTPEYMPPEQLAGAAADARSDQFAFCATAWEALSGVRPFAGDSASTIAAAQASELPRAADRVPRRLRPILARGLAVVPAARWPSMDALLGALERTWRRPRRIAILVSALALAAVAIIAVVGLVRRQTASPWHPRIADLPAYVENGDGIAISPDGTTYAYASDRDQADTYRIYLVPAAGGEPHAITPEGESFQSPRWTRDGKALLMGHWDRASLTYNIVKRVIADGSSNDLGPGFAADDCGDAIAIASYDGEEGKLELLRAGRRVILARTSRQYILVPRCERTGQRIVFTRGPSPLLEHPADDLFTVDREGHEVQLTDGNATANGTFTPDGRSVVFSALLPDGAISLFEVAATGGSASRLTYDSGPHIAPDVAPDGATVVFDRDESARIPIAGGDGPTRKLSARRETLLVVAPTPDGASIVADRLGALGSEIVVIATRDGSERRLVEGSHPFVSLDGKRVWFRHHGGNPALASIALEGGVEAPSIVLPGELITGVDAADGAHLSLRVGTRIESWRLGLDHRLVSENVAGLVIPAPSGGWRAIRTWADAYHYKFVAPDGTTSPLDIRAESERPTWLDAHRFAYAVEGAFHIVDVTTGTEVGKLPGPNWGEHAVLAADGVHWCDLMTIGHVTHHVIENFATRPWRY